MSAPALSYYALLSLSPTASPDQIRAAYLRLAKDLHPDRAPPEEQAAATAQFQELARAYKVLSDPALRKAYNAFLARPSASAPSARYHPGATPAAHAPDSPFPGHRVPPGGYPSRPSAQSRRPPFSASPHAPHHLAPGASLDPAALLDPFSGLSLELDPFELFEQAQAQMQGLYGGAPPRPLPPRLSGGSGLAREREHGQERWSHPPCSGGGGGGAWESYGGLPRTARREWSEGRREANGDGVTFQAMKEVEHTPDGGVRWRGESVTVEYISGLPLQDHRPPPSFAAHYPSPVSRRPPSPARPAYATSPFPLTLHHGYRPRSSSLSRLPPLSAPPPPALPPTKHRRPASPARQVTYFAPSPYPGGLALPPPPPQRSIARRPPSPARSSAPLALPPPPLPPQRAHTPLALAASSPRPRRSSLALPAPPPTLARPDSPLFGAGELELAHGLERGSRAGEGRERERVMRSFGGRRGEGVV